MAELVRQVAGNNAQVNVAGNSNTVQADPADYQPLPTINFDINLNSKRSYSRNPRRAHSLRNNYGYSFSVGSTIYVVIGLEALDSRSPDFTRTRLEHELYHAQHHLGRARSGADAENANTELETYTNDFLNNFHLLNRYGPQWNQLIGYYQDADDQAKQRALNALVNYYNRPPVPAATPASERGASVQGIQRAFARWLRRRLADSNDKQLIQDLERRLHLGSSSPTHEESISP
jgi:hypothetical protein